MESLRAPAKRRGINRKTAAKWKERGSVTDLPTGPKEAHSTVLPLEGEVIVVAFDRRPRAFGALFSMLSLERDPV